MIQNLTKPLKVRNERVDSPKQIKVMQVGDQRSYA